MPGTYDFNRGHGESFLPAPETRLPTMQICGCAERKFACLKTDWERFLPSNIFFEENQSSADPAGSSFLSFFPETKPMLFCVPLADFLLFPCCSLAVFLLSACCRQQQNSKRVAGK
jgi:hypothetical protein